MKQVLLSAPYMLPSVQRFLPVFTHYGIELIIADVKERLEEADLLRYAGQFDGAICGDDRFNMKVLSACTPRLKVISKWGTGIDSIDSEAAGRLGIQVRNTPNAFTIPVADSVMGYILAFARNIPWMDSEIRQGRWIKIKGKSLSEMTLGVVGVGNIGKALLTRARGFGMRLLGNDIVEIDPNFLSKNQIVMMNLPDLLAQSDFISLNCVLNPSSYHLINKESLAHIKASAVIINTARGPIIDEPALIQALQTGKIGGAALDVYEIEPLPADSPLLKMQNVLLGSHNSNNSSLAWELVHWNTIKNLLDGLGIPSEDLDSLKHQI